MAKAPIFTVVNPFGEPRLVAFGRRAVPIDIGRDKALPLTADEAVALAAEGFKVSGPDGKAIEPKAGAAKKAKD